MMSSLVESKRAVITSFNVINTHLSFILTAGFATCAFLPLLMGDIPLVNCFITSRRSYTSFHAVVLHTDFAYRTCSCSTRIQRDRGCNRFIYSFERYVLAMVHPFLWAIPKAIEERKTCKNQIARSDDREIS